MNDSEIYRGNALEVFATFLRLGLTSFGGPIAHIGYFRKEFVERKQWLSESVFSQLFALCQLLPGPTSSQLGFSIGLLRAGWLGALGAFVAFTLPSVALLLGFSQLVPTLDSQVSDGLIHGLKLVAVAVVADAVVGMARNLCREMKTRLLASAAAVCLFFLDVSGVQFAVLVGGALVALLWRVKPSDYLGDQIVSPISWRMGIYCLGLYLCFFILLINLSDNNARFAIANAFYQSGALVFGGGHVVLPLLEESVVATGLINSEDFLAGYGAAQAVPGPLFSFAAYLGSNLEGEISGMEGASIALAAIFAPGFLLVSACLPFWQRVAANPIANRVVVGINAVVVGILAAALYDPLYVSVIKSPVDFVIVGCGVLMLRTLQLSPLVVVFWCLSMSHFMSSIS